MTPHQGSSCVIADQRDIILIPSQIGNGPVIVSRIDNDSGCGELVEGQILRKARLGEHDLVAPGFMHSQVKEFAHLKTSPNPQVIV